jgi:hypothetical protein
MNALMTWFGAKQVGWFMNLLIGKSSSWGPTRRPEPAIAKGESVMPPCLVRESELAKACV